MYWCVCAFLCVCVRSRGEHACLLLWFARCIIECTVLNRAYLMCFFQGSIAKKPYNPIIGETFHCSWVLPSDDMSPHHTPDTLATDQTTGNGDNMAEGETEEKGDSGDEERGRREEGRLLYYCAEQVSHHPPSKCVVSISDFTLNNIYTYTGIMCYSYFE